MPSEAPPTDPVLRRLYEAAKARAEAQQRATQFLSLAQALDKIQGAVRDEARQDTSPATNPSPSSATAS